MIFTVMHNGSPYFTVDASEIIGVAKVYNGEVNFSTVMLLKNGGSYKFPFPTKDEQLNKIRQNWLLARTKTNFPSPDVIINV